MLYVQDMSSLLIPAKVVEDDEALQFLAGKMCCTLLRKHAPAAFIYWEFDWPFQNSSGNWGEFQILTNR